MKKHISLSLITIACSLTSISFAASGTATLPFWSKNDQNNYCYISLTNISDSSVTVMVKFIEFDTGTVYDESTEPGTTNVSIEKGFSGDPLSASGATLAPYQTGWVRLHSSGTPRAGYSIVEWYSDELTSKSLIGVLTLVNFKDIAGDSIPFPSFFQINGGQPF